MTFFIKKLNYSVNLISFRAREKTFNENVVCESKLLCYNVVINLLIVDFKVTD